MKRITVTYDCIEVFQTLKKHFIVVFESPKSSRDIHAKSIQVLSSIETVLEVVVDSSSPCEDYVVDILKAKSLPFVAVYLSGSLWKSCEVDNLSTITNDISKLGGLFAYSDLLKYEINSSIDIISTLMQTNDLTNNNTSEPIYIFVSGDRSSVGKSTTCLAMLASLVKRGVPPSLLAYIKPVTQCEATQPVVKYCERSGISHQGIGPVVFYKGFTRAYLAGETDSSEQLIQSAVKAVKAIGVNKRFVLIDGVGYPSVGSICNISNADVAKALQCPVVLVGKEGVGDAVDSFNMNSAFFELKGVTVLGGIFNKLPLSGFYSLDACKSAVTSYFSQYKPHQLPYGFIPVITNNSAESINGSSESSEAIFENMLSDYFLQYVDVNRLLYDIWTYNKITKTASVMVSSSANHITRPTLQSSFNGQVSSPTIRSIVTSPAPVIVAQPVVQNSIIAEDCNNSNNKSDVTPVKVSLKREKKWREMRSFKEPKEAEV